jgi:hypothetical protein
MSTTTTQTNVATSQSLDYLSPRYKNIAFKIPATQKYTVGDHDQANAPGIAYNIYGDKGYWWVICMYNGIIDPVTELVPGTVLELPSINDINSVLSQDTASETSGISTVIV